MVARSGQGSTAVSFLGALFILATMSACSTMSEGIGTVPDGVPEWIIREYADEPPDGPTLSELTRLDGRHFPLPDETPFDADRNLRRKYIKGYSRGVQWGLHTRGGHYLLKRPRTTSDKAWNLGFEAGWREALRTTQAVIEEVMDGPKNSS